MKQSIRLLSLVLITFFLQKCNEIQNQGPPGQVRFNFSPGRDPGNGGRLMEEIPAGSYLVVSIQTSPGNYVYNDHHLQLLKAGDNFISPPLALAPGNYFITEFLVVSPQHEVLYATPKAGSALADAVSHPLPLDFSITPDGLLNLTLEVVSVVNTNPEDFGYVSFDLDEMESEHFQVSVFISTESGLEYTSAELSILTSGDTIKSQSLRPNVNSVYFNGDPAAEFSLTIIKQGYGRYSRSFNLYGLLGELNGKPLVVVLQPALTFTAVVETDGYLSDSFYFDVTGPQGNATIDWGDGMVETFALYDHSEDHLYNKAGKYFVSVTGDLQNITDFYSYYGDGPMAEVNLMHLGELKDVRIGFTQSPKIIDLSQNKKLEYVDVSVALDLEQLIIAPDNKIKALNILASNHMSTGAIDDVIDNLYESVVASDVDRTHGYFVFYDVTGSGPPTGPPSPEAYAKLHDLYLNYGWSIEPL